MPDQELVKIDEVLDNAMGDKNFSPIAAALADSIVLDKETKVYRLTLELNEENEATVPVPDDSDIPTKQAYFDYELEITVPSTATLLNSSFPSSWSWIPGGEIPILAENFAGKVLHIAARLDCQSRRTLANTWRIEDAN